MSVAGFSEAPTDQTPRRAAGRWRLLVHGLVALAVFVWAFAVLDAARPGVEFQPDESNQIYTVYYFAYFVKGDWDNEAWRELYYVLTHPPGHRYVLGAGLWLQGHDPEKVSNQELENRRRRRPPSEVVLRDARRVSIAFGAGAIALLYVVGAQLGLAPAGIVAVLLAGASPFLQDHLVRAVMESPLAFSMMVALALSLAAFGRATGGFGVGNGVLTGLALGLGLLNKLTAVLSFPALGLACLGTALVARRRSNEQDAPRPSPLPPRPASWWRPLVWFGVVGLFCWGLFVAVNPFLWSDPLGRTAAMFRQRGYELLERQQRRIPQDAVPNPLDRPGLVLGHTLVNKTWANTTLGVPIDVPLAAVGSAVIGMMAWSDWRHARRIGPAAVFGLWALTYLLGIIAGYGMDWDRYAVPLFLPAALLSGVGVQWLVQRGRSTMRLAVGDRPFTPQAGWRRSKA